MQLTAEKLARRVRILLGVPLSSGIRVLLSLRGFFDLF